MCGRYQIMDDKDIEEINKILQEINAKYNNTGMSAKTGEIFPTNTVPILSLADNKPSLSLMKWGFPKWDGKGTIINAKSETASEKKMFSKPLMQQRCVIPSTGFFEWNQRSDTKAKDKYLFRSDVSPMLYMAGIYSMFKTDAGIIEHFVILTQDANNFIKDIHDRMPVIIYKNELVSWLSDNSFSQYAFERDNVILERKLIV